MALQGLVEDRHFEALDLFELDAFPFRRLMKTLSNSTDSNDFFLRAGDVPNDNVAWLRLLKVPILLTFVPLFVMGRVGLPRPNGRIFKAPDLRVGVEPPVGRTV